MIAPELGGVHPVEVVGSEIVEVHAVAEHVVGDNEDAVDHGDPGSFRAATLADTSELRAQVTLAGAGRCPCGLEERRSRPIISRTRPTFRRLPALS